MVRRVYVYFAFAIAATFFPPGQGQDGTLGLILTVLTFFVSYLVRPIGAMVIGAYGDRAGRKAALTLTIGLMAAGLLLLALAPGAKQVGPVAPLLLMTARILQGLSAGGEFGTATAFLTENTEQDKAFYASWQFATQGISMFLAAGFGLVINAVLSQADVAAWGWRIPFFFGLIIAPVGWYIRKHMDDTPEFVSAEHVHAPLKTALTTDLPVVITAAGLIGVSTVTVYFLSYMPTFAMKHLGMPAWSGYLGSVISGLILLVGCPLVGRQAERIGLTRLMLWASIAGIVLIAPLFTFMVRTPSVLSLVVVQVVMGIVLTPYAAPLPALMSEMFPVEVRTTGLSISYNVGVALLGGLTPVVMEFVISTTKNNLTAPIWYVTVALITLVSLLVTRNVFKHR